jgi:hypothetical protein
MTTPRLARMLLVCTSALSKASNDHVVVSRESWPHSHLVKFRLCYILEFVVVIMGEVINLIIKSFENLPLGFYGIDGMGYCIRYNISVWARDLYNFLIFLGGLLGCHGSYTGPETCLQRKVYKTRQMRLATGVKVKNEFRHTGPLLISNFMLYPVY